MGLRLWVRKGIIIGKRGVTNKETREWNTSTTIKILLHMPIENEIKPHKENHIEGVDQTY